MTINYLYNSGTYESNWSPGPSGNLTSSGSSPGFTLTKRTTYLEVSGNSSTDESYATYVSTSINLSGQNKIFVKWDKTGSFGLDIAYALLGVDTSPTVAWPSQSVLLQEDFTSFVPGGYSSINVSGLSGNYYVYAGVKRDSNYGNALLKVYQIFSSGTALSTGSPPAGGSGSLSATLNNIPITATGILTNNASFSQTLISTSINSSGYLTNNGSTTASLNDSYCSGESLVDWSGQLNKTLSGLSINSYGLSLTDNFGYTPYPIQLDSLNLDTQGTSEILGSGYSSLNNLNVISFAGFSTNFGGLNNSLTPLGPATLVSSGSNYGPNTGFSSYTLADSISYTLADSISSFTVEPPIDLGGDTGGRTRYSLDTKRWHGKSCAKLKKETGSTLNLGHDCFSALSPLAVSVASYTIPKIVTRCNCSVNLPVYLNRVHNEDVQVSVNTEIGVGNIEFSGAPITPAATGVDFINYSGLLTIPSGSLYANISVSLVDSGLIADKYFKIKCNYVKTRNACLETPVMNVIIKESGA